MTFDFYDKKADKYSFQTKLFFQISGSQKPHFIIYQQHTKTEYYSVKKN
jgi:hypothetical protein